MIQLKYAAPKIGALNDQDLRMWVKSLLLKIHVITGWTLPSGDIMTVLKDQFQKKLLEDYPMLNVEEIEYAFRQSGTVIEDWGKELNLNLIDKVLLPYGNERFKLSLIEEKKKLDPEQKIYTDEEIINQRRGEIETAFQALKRGKYPLIHFYFSEVLKHDGLMNEEDDISEFFVKRLGMNAGHIYEKE